MLTNPADFQPSEFTKSPNVRGRVTFSIEAVFQHQTKCSQFVSIGEPGAVLHPCWIGWAFSSDHQEHWAAWLVEGVIYKVSLKGKTEHKK